MKRKAIYILCMSWIILLSTSIAHAIGTQTNCTTSDIVLDDSKQDQKIGKTICTWQAGEEYSSMRIRFHLAKNISKVSALCWFSSKPASDNPYVIDKIAGGGSFEQSIKFDGMPYDYSDSHGKDFNFIVTTIRDKLVSDNRYQGYNFAYLDFILYAWSEGFDPGAKIYCVFSSNTEQLLATMDLPGRDN